jgi:hypothetical protein
MVRSLHAPEGGFFMCIARYSLPALLVLLVLPAAAQLPGTNTFSPQGLAPLTPVTPAVGVTPGLNTATPVGSVGIGGTMTQTQPNLPGSSALSSSNSAAIVPNATGLSMPGASTPVTTATVPGYTPPGSSNLPGYTAPPGSLSFPSTSSPSLSGTGGVTGSGSVSGVPGISSGSGSGLIRTTP